MLTLVLEVSPGDYIIIHLLLLLLLDYLLVDCGHKSIQWIFFTGALHNCVLH